MSDAVAASGARTGPSAFRSAMVAGLLLGVVALGACERPASDGAAGAGADSSTAAPGAGRGAFDTAATPPSALDPALGDAAHPASEEAPGPDDGLPAAGDSAPGDSAVPPPMAGFDTVFAYFTTAAEEQVPAPRPVPESLHGLRAAFTELLEGPTPAERDAGLQSWFSRETAGMLRGVRFEDGFAVVDFEDLRPVIPNAVSSAGALMLLGELTATALQFPAVERVEFRIEGSCEALMAWLQFGCYPIRRATWDPPPGFRMAVR